MDLCILCKANTTEQLSKLTEVGLETLRSACELRHDDELCKILDSHSDSLFVHGSCRRAYTRMKRPRQQIEEASSDGPTLRSCSTFVKLGGGCFCVGIWIGNMTCGSPGAT